MSDKTERQATPSQANKKGISVVCKSGAFRRCGYSFGKSPVIIEATSNNAGLIKIIKSEKMLSVTDL